MGDFIFAHCFPAFVLFIFYLINHRYKCSILSGNKYTLDFFFDDEENRVVSKDLKKILRARASQYDGVSGRCNATLSAPRPHVLMISTNT